MNGDVLFLCQFFYPEYISSATLTFDTADYLASCGLKVGVLCGYPKEYSKEKSVPLRETVSGVDIKRLRYLQLGRSSFIGRLVNYFSFTLSAFMNIGMLKKYRSVIVYSNPPILPAIAVLGKMLFKIKLVFVAYDVYPEIGYASGSIKRGDMIDKVMKCINRSLYKNADKVVALTDEMKEFLYTNRKGIQKKDIVTIANWAHEKTVAQSPDAYRRFGYEDGQFIISYFGNMGTCQDIDTLLSAANLMKDDDSVRFLVIGHGNKMDHVKRYLEEHGLKNVQLLDYLTGNDFEQAVSITSAFIVSLERGLKGTCAPSKYYSYLQGGHPVIAIVEEGSYLAEEVETKQVGCHVDTGDAQTLKNQIRRLYENEQERYEMGLRAEQLYLNEYDKSIAMEKYRSLFDDILE